MTNVGGKIKGLVVFLMVIGLLASVILFFVGNNAYQEDKSCIEYATVYGGGRGYSLLEEAGNNAYNGLQMRNLALAAGLSIVLGALPMYGFGVLVECAERKTYLLGQLLEEQKKTNKLLSKAE